MALACGYMHGSRHDRVLHGGITPQLSQQVQDSYLHWQVHMIFFAFECMHKCSVMHAQQISLQVAVDKVVQVISLEDN